MNYIYCYRNKINNKKYVGQTNNINRRIREHRSCAFNEKSSSYNDLIHKKIREYGEENFEIEILENLYNNDWQEVNNRERYWIKELNTYCGDGMGYNMDLGGSRKYNSLLNEKELLELKQDIKNGIDYYSIEKKYNISASFISSINNGIYYFDEKECYPLFKYYKTDEDYEELIDLLLNSSYTLKRIAEMLEIGESTVKKINEGKMRKGIYPTYPIRKKSINEQRADKIKNLLLTTKLSNKEIAKMTNASEETVRRIKVGQSFKDESLSYPLNNL